MTCARWLTPSVRAVSTSDSYEEDAIQIGTLVYYLAQSGAKFAGVPFDYDLDDFLGLIDMADMDAMTTALVALLGGGGNQKKAKASR